MANIEWNSDVVYSRIMSQTDKKRYAAGSPDPCEVGVYAGCLPENSSIGVVLGMTPELRNMAAQHCSQLISIDHSEAAIATYKDWLAPALRHKEQVVHGDWSALESILPEAPDFILGDGVFGNIVPVDKYSNLLCAIRAALSRKGCFVTRHCLMPEAVLDKPEHRRDLLEKFRRHLIDEAGFGLSMRLQGYVDIAYDRAGFVLDNAKVFSAVDRDHESGMLSLSEYQIIRRYLFGGLNTIPTRNAWEALLNKAGFTFERRHCRGKYWYDYYPIYVCRPL
ncbi:class I SAM-dependent methyltransferase [Syntrophotalea acetylenica]|nr:class I SAM-dependent methyltransferase [Syntrophotalea acetylenica]